MPHFKLDKMHLNSLNGARDALLSHLAGGGGVFRETFVISAQNLNA